MKKILSLIFSLVLLVTSSTVAFAREGVFPSEEVMNVQVNENIGFVLYQDTTIENAHEMMSRAKSYTSDSYSGYFYYVDSGNKISDHKFTAKFSYDNTLATCYETTSSCNMLDDNSNLRPKAVNEGRNNVSPTNVYGYVSFVLYNTNNTVNSEVTIKIYCNQIGETWVNRQG